MILLLVCAALLAAEEKPATQQPIPLSHKTHTAAGVKCLDCHLMRKPGFAAGITCRADLHGMPHERENGQRCDSEAGGLCEHEKAGPLGAPLSDSRLVSFSHAVHHKEADIGCDICHGRVAAREVLSKEKATSMASCMECHASRKAPNACNVCHDIR